jgi:hypothetical protein
MRLTIELPKSRYYLFRFLMLFIITASLAPKQLIYPSNIKKSKSTTWLAPSKLHEHQLVKQCSDCFQFPSMTLQEAANTNLAAIHAKRIKILPKQLARRNSWSRIPLSGVVMR